MRRFWNSVNVGPTVDAKPSLQHGKFLILLLNPDDALRMLRSLSLFRNVSCPFPSQQLMINGYNTPRLAPFFRIDLPHIHLDYIIE
jgi:hypothetical protein